MAGQEASQPSSLSHRLPTVSASQALQTLHTRGARTISTGIVQLDKLLTPSSLPGHDVSGGYIRGKVTEIFGPPGVGKTAFGIQAAVNALREHQNVIWIDAACAPLIPRRILNVLSASQDSSQEDSHSDADDEPPPSAAQEQVTRFFHYLAAPTLAHLLALFMHSPAAFPPQNTSLVIIDSLSTLLDNAYPRNTEVKTKTEQTRWAAGRRFTVLNEIISTFSRFAALHDIALLITCQTITRIRGTSRALLVPAISGVEWENGVSTRLVLFRDWVRQGRTNDHAHADKLHKARFAGVVKTNGVAVSDERDVGSVVPFSIQNAGLCDLSTVTDDSVPSIVLASQVRPPKRPFAEMDDSGPEPDSDELYGWIEEDEVSAEGLLIDEGSIPIANDAKLQPDVGQEERCNKIARQSPL